CTTLPPPPYASTLSLHDALPICHRDHGALRAHLRAGIEVLDPALDEFRDFGRIELHDCSLSFQCGLERGELRARGTVDDLVAEQDRKSTRLNSSHVKISYAVFCL